MLILSFHRCRRREDWVSAAKELSRVIEACSRVVIARQRRTVNFPHAVVAFHIHTHSSFVLLNIDVSSQFSSVRIRRQLNVRIAIVVFSKPALASESIKEE